MPTLNNTEWPKPVIGLAGFSGSGKTTLLCQLLETFTQQNLRVGVIKHSHHQIELDKPGKDSYRLRHSGASQLLLASPNQVTLFMPQHDHDDLAAQLRLLDWDSLDCVIVEGFRHAAIPKLEIHRPELGKAQLNLQDPHIFAVASNAELSNCSLPVWPLDDIAVVANRLKQYLT